MSLSTRSSFSLSALNWGLPNYDNNSGSRGVHNYAHPHGYDYSAPWSPSTQLDDGLDEVNPLDFDLFAVRMSGASFSGASGLPQLFHSAGDPTSSVPAYNVALPDPSSFALQESYTDNWSQKDDGSEHSEMVSQTPEYFHASLPSLATSHDADRQQRPAAKLTASVSSSTGFACPIGSCSKNYRRKGDLKFHILEKHPGYESLSAEVSQPKSSKDGKEFPCPFENCKCGFKWERDLRRHFKRKHLGLNLYPELAPQAPIITNETRFDEKNMCNWKCSKDSTSDHY